MQLTINVDQEILDRAEQALRKEGVTTEQAITTYLWRIAHGEEPVDTNLNPDGTPRPRTLRQQTYR
jgi:antitoxin component of RelBE/YafQ-DinJ toxin-antitoxin module